MDLTREYVMNTYSRFPIALVKGSGVRVVDSEGREYLDFVAGIAVNSLGHCHPRVVAAIKQQAETLIHCSNLYYIEPQAHLARLLVSGTHFGKAFFCNSGAEANEAAIKLARRYTNMKFGEGRFKIISAHDSFHGRTLAAISATGQPKYQKGFEPLVPGFEHVPFNDLAALEAACTDKTCAVILEAIQGESGVHPATPEYLKGAWEICKRAGSLLIIDEVQTGLGRTGKMFAFEHYGIEPDIVTLAKSLAGGVPIGAVLARDEVAEAFGPGSHASTFGGNPLATAAAIAVLETLRDEHVIENARVMGEYLQEGLRKLAMGVPEITEVRGVGLMIGVGLVGRARDVVTEAMKNGLLTTACGDNTLRLVPPLIVTRRDIDECLSILTLALRNVFSS
ncbi:MAG TPA: acetylornithine transaminase [Firmicutes bacterium]|nr:acetylornithine transaminase [Bacillota bacterium]